MTGKQTFVIAAAVGLLLAVGAGAYIYSRNESLKASSPDPAFTENAKDTVSQQVPEDVSPSQKIIWSYSGTFLQNPNSYALAGADKDCKAQDGHLDEALKMGWKIIAISHYDLPNGSVTCIGRDVALEKQ